MRTLALLGFLLLLASQAPAQLLQEPADQLPSQDQPGAQDQGMAVSFAGDAPFVQEASGLRRVVTCYCRPGFCSFPEQLSGSCTLSGRRYNLCCR